MKLILLLICCVLFSCCEISESTKIHREKMKAGFNIIQNLRVGDMCTYETLSDVRVEEYNDKGSQNEFDFLKVIKEKETKDAITYVVEYKRYTSYNHFEYTKTIISTIKTIIEDKSSTSLNQ